MILVTGGTGLVGSNLLQSLVEKGEKVRAIKREKSNLQWTANINDQIEWFDCDLLDVQGLYEAMEGVDYVYHSAAMVSFAPKDAERMRKVNQEGTANVVNMALERGIKKLVHVSSIAALGRGIQGKVVTEKRKWVESNNNTDYAISKYLAEQEVWRGQAEGLQTVIVNPSMILGRGDWTRSSGQLITNVWKGLRFYTAGGNGFVDVKDVVDIMIQLMASDVHGERFIVNGANIKYKDFFDQVAEHLNKPKPSIKASPFLLGILWRLEAIRSKFTGKTPLATRETAKTAVQTNVYDNRKVCGVLGYKFRDIEETIGRVCGEFKEDL